MLNFKQGLTVLVGAGFSKPAGLPVAKEIINYFDRDNTKKILSFTSGEKKWVDFASEIDLSNGRNSPDFIVWGYVLNGLVKKYLEIHSTFDNYEDFYFKTNNYREKQVPERYNPLTKEKVQTFHFNISPQLLTGLNKSEKSITDKMFSKLLIRSKKALYNNSELLIIGYSYTDEHVNQLILSAICLGNLKSIINVNPYKKFPFRELCSNIKLVDLVNINQII